MRYLMMAAVLSLVMGLSPEAAAWSGEDWTVLRPGSLYLKAGDGRLALYWQKELDDARDAESRKEAIKYILRDEKNYYPKFNTNVGLFLSARGRKASYMVIYELKPGDFGFHFFITPDYRYKEDDHEKLLDSVEITVRIDDRPIGAGQWTILPWAEGLVNDHWDFYVAPNKFLPPEAAAEFTAGFLEAAGNGRTMTVQTILGNGDAFSADFDLSGLDEGLDRLRQKSAEINQSVERRVEELKKQLEALN